MEKKKWLLGIFAPLGKFFQQIAIKQFDIGTLFLDKFFTLHVPQRTGKRFRSRTQQIGKL